MSDDLLQEAADMLRYARLRISDLQTAIVAFGDRRYSERLGHDFDRAKGTIAAIDDVLSKLPPEIPMSAEQEAKVARVVAAALNKRFGDGNESELSAAIDDWIDEK